MFRSALVGLSGIAWAAMLYLSVTPTAAYWAQNPPDEYYPEAAFLVIGLPLATIALGVSVAMLAFSKGRAAPIRSAAVLAICAVCGLLVVGARFYPPEANVFVVKDDMQNVAEATLVICGTEETLHRYGNALSLHKASDCEGSGYVRLRYANGDEHDCPVGYVTPAAAQRFEYHALAGGCE